MKEEESSKNISIDPIGDSAQEMEGNKSQELLTKSCDTQGKVEKAVEKALEQRINLEVLFSQKFTDLRHEINSRFWFSGVIFTLILFALGFLGRDYITQKVSEKFTQPEINKVAQKAMEEKGGSFVATKIKPLEDRVQQLNKDIQTKQTELANAQAQLGQMLEIQQLSIGARAGSRADYEKLLQLSKSEKENIRRSAEAAVRDLGYYFSADRYQLSGYGILVDSKSRSRISYSVEELAEELENPDVGMREAAVNVVADTKKKYFVGHLVEMLSKEPNLRICARITRALEMLTNERFDPLAFDAVASWWKQNGSREEYSWPFQSYFDGVATMNAGLWDEALIHFERMIGKEPQALRSLTFKAVILTEKGKYDDAAKAFKQVEDADKNYRWLYVWRAFFFLKQNKQDEAVTSINRALEISPGTEEFIRSQSWAQALLSNKAIKWPSQNTEIKKEETRQDQK